MSFTHAQRWVLAACVLASSMAFIDSSVVNVALPTMELELQASLSQMTWVINAYTLCMSALLLIGGAAADQFGRRRIFVIGVIVFALASIGCGSAGTVEWLIVARALQGIGAALLIPCSLAIIGASFDAKSRGAAIGIWSGASAIAAGGSPMLGGWLVDHSSWRTIFLINPAVAIPTLLIALRRVPESIDPKAHKGLDLTGAILAFLGLGLIVYGLIAAADLGWSSYWVIGSLIGGVVMLGTFIADERQSATPMVPLSMFHSLTFSGVNILTLLLYGALGGSLFYMPFLLIQVHGYSATQAGGIFLPLTIVLAALSKWGGGLVDRFGARWPLIIGPTIAAIGFALATVPGTSGPYLSTFLLPMIVLGFGMSITVAPLTTTVLNSVQQHQTGIASGINNAVAQVASLLLIAVLSTVGQSMLNHSLDRRLAGDDPGSPLAALAGSPPPPPTDGITPDVRRIVDTARHGFVMPAMPPDVSPRDQQTAKTLIANSFLDTIRRILLIAAGLAFASALSAVLTIKSDGGGHGGEGSRQAVGTDGHGVAADTPGGDGGRQTADAGRQAAGGRSRTADSDDGEN